MPAPLREQFGAAVKLSEAMLRLLKAGEGLGGPLKATLIEGPEPVGALPAPPASLAVSSGAHAAVHSTVDLDPTLLIPRPGRVGLTCVRSCVQC